MIRIRLCAVCGELPSKPSTISSASASTARTTHALPQACAKRKNEPYPGYRQWPRNFEHTFPFISSTWNGTESSKNAYANVPSNASCVQWHEPNCLPSLVIFAHSRWSVDESESSTAIHHRELRAREPVHMRQENKIKNKEPNKWVISNVLRRFHCAMQL